MPERRTGSASTGLQFIVVGLLALAAGELPPDTLTVLLTL